MQEAKYIRYDTGRMFMGSTPWLIAGAVILILLVSLLAAFLTGSADPVGIAILLGVSAVVVVAFRFNYARMEIDANEMRLTWSPFYHATIFIGAVKSAAPITIRGIKYGFGLRMGSFGVALIQDTGPAIRIEAEQAYIVSTGIEKRLKAVMTALADAGIPVHSEGDFMQPDPPPGPEKVRSLTQELLTKLRRLPWQDN